MASKKSLETTVKNQRAEVKVRKADVNRTISQAGGALTAAFVDAKYADEGEEQAFIGPVPINAAMGLTIAVLAAAAPKSMPLRREVMSGGVTQAVIPLYNAMKEVFE